MKYFKEYKKQTGMTKFTLRFYLTKPSGFPYQRSLLGKALQSSYFKRDIFGKEVEGTYLTFDISTETNLEKMVVNILYYMIKYNFIATIKQ